MDHNLKVERVKKMKNIENKVDIVGKLHFDLAHKILKLLDLKDWASCWYTCRRWRNLIGDDYFWKLVCEKNSFLEEKIFLKCGFARKEDYWQLVYNYYTATNLTWRKGLFEEVDYFQYDFKDVLYLDDEIVVGYLNFDLNPFDCSTTIQIIIINHLERKVQTKYSLERFFDTDVLKVFRYKDLLFAYIISYRSRVYCFQMISRLTVIGLDSDIEEPDISEPLWSILPAKQITFHENFIATISWDRSNCLKVYNIETDVIEYNCPNVVSYGITNGKLVILKDNALKVVNFKDNSEYMLIPCKQILNVKTVLTSNTSILSLCSTGHICCWCAKTERELQHFSVTFDEDYEGVLSLHNDKLIYYDVEFEATQVWNVVTGNCQFVIRNLFYLISCNSRFMVGVDIGDQRVDVRCFESGRPLLYHINGMNISKLHATNIAKLFRLFLRLRKQCNQSNIVRKVREMRTLLTLTPAIQITETCLATTKPSKLSILDYIKRRKNPKIGIMVLNFRGREF